MSAMTGVLIKRGCLGGFPGDTRVGNLPSEVGDTGSIPGGGIKISCALGQLGLRATGLSLQTSARV